MLSLKGSEITLFATDAYNSGTDTSDVTDTEQYSIAISDAHNGIKLKIRYVEISGSTETDSLLIRIYDNITSTWEALEVDREEHDLGTAAVGTEKIAIINIDFDIFGPGEKRLGVLASGGTNPFDVQVTGKYY